MAEGIARGRDAFDQQAWGRAYHDLSAAADEEPLQVEDLERLAAAAYLTGRSEESLDVWARAHHSCAEVGDVARAARCAFWIAFALLNAGELARGGGWVDRAQRLLDERRVDCVERGHIRYAAALRSVFSGDVETALAGFRQAGGIGVRYRDPELMALARIGEGRCLVYMGEIARGVALLDEAMVAVGASEVSAIAVGDSYCTVIEGCRELFDVRRAQEWTAALSRWCDAQPELVLYRGQCLVHRAELLQLRGAWGDALDEVQRACARLADPDGQPALGAAQYVRGDLHRLQGALGEAEDAYRAANALGHDPQPGLALLRLAQGHAQDAVAMIRRVLDEAEPAVARARILAAYVEIMLAVGDATAARVAADELSALAAEIGRPLLLVQAAHADGAVHLAESDAHAALRALRRARTGWQELDARYLVARCRVLIAFAYRLSGDEDSATMELDVARAEFAHLGAAPDAAQTEALLHTSQQTLAPGLSPRELEVLAEVAKGHTNRQIARQLAISEKTVASHLTHIFTKLDLPSRAAAAVYATEHGLTDARPLRGGP